MKGMHMVAFTLLVIGGLNWLLIGLGEWNLVAMVLGGVAPWAERAVYVLVGLSAVWEVAMHKSNCRMCNPAGMPKTM
jgi:uncharacterized protein